MKLSGKMIFEVEVEISGTFADEDPDVGLGQGVEDIEVESFVGIKRVTPFGKTPGWSRTDLLRGLDARAAQRLCDNILDFLDIDEVQTELLESLDA